MFAVLYNNKNMNDETLLIDDVINICNKSIKHLKDNITSIPIYDLTQLRDKLFLLKNDILKKETHTNDNLTGLLFKEWDYAIINGTIKKNNNRKISGEEVKLLLNDIHSKRPHDAIKFSEGLNKRVIRACAQISQRTNNKQVGRPDGDMRLAQHVALGIKKRWNEDENFNDTIINLYNIGTQEWKNTVSK
tara:strand:+ start:59 stop:628 length:570 start_codon:yes stop_codon:yes gene_type:complete